jgi:hypothetical protein
MDGTRFSDDVSVDNENPLQSEHRRSSGGEYDPDDDSNRQKRKKKNKAPIDSNTN